MEVSDSMEYLFSNYLSPLQISDPFTTLIVALSTLLAIAFAVYTLNSIRESKQQLNELRQRQKIQFKPVVEILGSNIREDEISLEITNKGNGVATELGISLQLSMVHRDDTEGEYHVSGERNLERRSDSTDAEEVHLTNEMSRTIAPGEQATFFGEAVVPSPPGTRGALVPFSTAIRNLREQSESDVLNISLILHYKDIIGNDYEQEFITGKLDLTAEFTSLEEAVEKIHLFENK